MPHIGCKDSILIPKGICDEFARQNVYFGFSDDYPGQIAMSLSIKGLPERFHFFCMGRVDSRNMISLPEDVMILLTGTERPKNVIVYRKGENVFIRNPLYSAG